jgi:hypothetical protein
MRKIIEIAISQIGYKETGKNITKYSADFDNKWPTYFNTRKQGVEWCSIYYNWCAVMAYGEQKAKTMLYEPKKDNCAAGCKYAANYYRNKGQFYSTPQEGDQIFFGKRGSESHTGLVEKVDSNYVWTIEGNKNNMVCECRYSLKDSSISGYGRPNWSLVDDNQPTPAPAPQPTPTPKEETCMVELPVLKKGSKNASVKDLQLLLNGKGFKGKNAKLLTVDGDFGTNTDHAVRNFQSNKGLTVDGIVGAKTWRALLT